MEQLSLSQQEWQDVDVKSSIIQLCCGHTGDHRPFWAYMAIKPSLYQEYIEKSDAGDVVNLEYYGSSLQKGWGSLPPAEIQEQMKKKYNIDHSFEDFIEAESNKERM